MSYYKKIWCNVSNGNKTNKNFGFDESGSVDILVGISKKTNCEFGKLVFNVINQSQTTIEYELLFGSERERFKLLKKVKFNKMTKEFETKLCN